MPKFALGSTQAINMSDQIWENTAKGIKTNTWTPSNNGLTSFSLGERRQISLLTLSEFKPTD